MHCNEMEVKSCSVSWFVALRGEELHNSEEHNLLTKENVYEV